MLAFFALIVYAPLPLAGRNAWSLGVLAAATWAILVLAALYSGLRKADLGRRIGAARWAIAGLAGFCIWVGVQLLPLSPTLRDWFTGTAGMAGPISADPTSTRVYLLTALTHLGGFLAALLLVHGRRRLLALAAVLVVSGLIQSIIAVGLLAYGQEYVYLGEAFRSDRALGTFTNADHLANYLALCLSAGLGLLIARLEPQAPARNRSEQWLRTLKFLMSPKMLLRLMLIVMVIALVLTRSRMANFAFFTSLLLIGAVLAWRSPQLRRPAIWLVGSLLVVDVLVVGQWVGLDRLMQRLENTAITDEAKPASRAEETLEQRQAGARDALEMIRQRPVSGFGGGTFYAVFPAFKGPTAYTGSYDHTHNDYVEIAADTGLVGLALLMSVVVLSLRRIARLMHDGEPRHHRGLATGLAMAVCVMSMHSFVDFSLQVPANALTFTVLLAAAWSMKPRRRNPLVSNRSPTERTAELHLAT